MAIGVPRPVAVEFAVDAEAGMADTATTYPRPADINHRNRSHFHLIDLTGRRKKVLEVGPASGYVTEALQKRGCLVTCIELDAGAAALAARFSERMVVADIEAIDLLETFPDERFDVVMFGDVLEHLVDPWRALRAVREILAPKGYVVASVPNVAHGSLRLSLLEGRFRYTDTGLLDRTHLRFFTRESLAELFLATGFDLTVWRQTTADPFEAEHPANPANYPATFVATLREDPDALAYQFIVRARPASNRRAPSFRPVPVSPVKEAFLRLKGEEDGIGPLHAAREALEAAVRERDKWLEEQRTYFGAALAEKDRLLGDKDGLLAEKDGLLAKEEAVLGEKDRLLAERERGFARVLGERERSFADAIAERDGLLSQERHLLLEARRQSGYVLVDKLHRSFERLAPPGSHRGLFYASLRRGLNYIVTAGPWAFGKRLMQPWVWLPRAARKSVAADWEQRGPLALDPDTQYGAWLQKHALTEWDVDRIRRAVQGFSYRPTISIIVPVYDTAPEWLDAAVDSVRSQLYENWELCMADDCSTSLPVRERLRSYSESDTRIKVTYLPENGGISAASNAALASATGEFVTFLDHDDELKPNALYELVRRLNLEPDLDLIYSDEDKRDPTGQLVEPFFKPDWSPDLVMSVNYVCHLAAYRRSILMELGGLRSACDFSQDHDLVLRFSERTDRIAHIPLPLYTWRMTPDSAANNVNAKPAARLATMKALSDALDRRHTPGEVLDGLWRGTYRVQYAIRGEPLVSIIIPTKDKVNLLKDCIESLRAKTHYKNYEILIVDNGSEEEVTKTYLTKIQTDPKIRVLSAPGPFNFSVLNNSAAEHAQGEHLLFLNNDIEVIDGGWLEALLEHSQREDVGAVGARLLYRDGRIQHAGVLVGLGGVAGHAHLFFPRDDPGYHCRAVMIQNFSAVTAACLMMRTSVFREVGGFDETNLAVAFGDVDLCLRVRQKGYLVVWTPYAELYHYESASRGYEDTEEKRARFGREKAFMRKQWAEVLDNDPYYNPNLTLDYHDFRIRI